MRKYETDLSEHLYVCSLHKIVGLHNKAPTDTLFESLRLANIKTNYYKSI